MDDSGQNIAVLHKTIAGRSSSQNRALLRRMCLAGREPAVLIIENRREAV